MSSTYNQGVETCGCGGGGSCGCTTGGGGGGATAAGGNDQYYHDDRPYDPKRDYYAEMDAHRKRTQQPRMIDYDPIVTPPPAPPEPAAKKTCGCSSGWCGGDACGVILQPSHAEAVFYATREAREITGGFPSSSQLKKYFEPKTPGGMKTYQGGQNVQCCYRDCAGEIGGCSVWDYDFVGQKDPKRIAEIILETSYHTTSHGENVSFTRYARRPMGQLELLEKYGLKSMYEERLESLCAQGKGGEVYEIPTTGNTRMRNGYGRRKTAFQELEDIREKRRRRKDAADVRKNTAVTNALTKEYNNKRKFEQYECKESINVDTERRAYSKFNYMLTDDYGRTYQVCSAFYRYALKIDTNTWRLARRILSDMILKGKKHHRWDSIDPTFNELHRSYTGTMETTMNRIASGVFVQNSVFDDVIYHSTSVFCGLGSIRSMKYNRPTYTYTDEYIEFADGYKTDAGGFYRSLLLTSNTCFFELLRPDMTGSQLIRATYKETPEKTDVKRPRLCKKTLGSILNKYAKIHAFWSVSSYNIRTMPSCMPHWLVVAASTTGTPSDSASYETRQTALEQRVLFNTTDCHVCYAACDANSGTFWSSALPKETIANLAPSVARHVALHAGGTFAQERMLEIEYILWHHAMKECMWAVSAGHDAGFYVLDMGTCDMHIPARTTGAPSVEFLETCPERTIVPFVAISSANKVTELDETVPRIELIVMDASEQSCIQRTLFLFRVVLLQHLTDMRIIIEKRLADIDPEEVKVNLSDGIRIPIFLATLVRFSSVGKDASHILRNMFAHFVQEVTAFFDFLVEARFGHGSLVLLFNAQLHECTSPHNASCFAPAVMKRSLSWMQSQHRPIDEDGYLSHPRREEFLYDSPEALVKILKSAFKNIKRVHIVPQTLTEESAMKGIDAAFKTFEKFGVEPSGARRFLSFNRVTPVELVEDINDVAVECCSSGRWGYDMDEEDFKEYNARWRKLIRHLAIFTKDDVEARQSRKRFKNASELWSNAKFTICTFIASALTSGCLVSGQTEKYFDLKVCSPAHKSQPSAIGKMFSIATYARRNTLYVPFLGSSMMIGSMRDPQPFPQSTEKITPRTKFVCAQKAYRYRPVKHKAREAKKKPGDDAAAAATATSVAAAKPENK